MPFRSTIVFFVIAAIVAAIVWGVVVVAGRISSDPQASRGGPVANPAPSDERAAPAEATFIIAA